MRRRQEQQEQKEQKDPEGLHRKQTAASRRKPECQQSMPRQKDQQRHHEQRRRYGISGPGAVNPEEAAGTRQSQQEQRKRRQQRKPCLWLYQQEQMGPQGLRRRQEQKEQKDPEGLHRKQAAIVLRKQQCKRAPRATAPSAISRDRQASKETARRSACRLSPRSVRSSPSSCTTSSATGRKIYFSNGGALGMGVVMSVFVMRTVQQRPQERRGIRDAQRCRARKRQVAFCVNGGRWRKIKKGQIFRSDLEEAATYSPTGKPQYHRRE